MEIELNSDLEEDMKGKISRLVKTKYLDVNCVNKEVEYEAEIWSDLRIPLFVHLEGCRSPRNWKLLVL